MRREPVKSLDYFTQFDIVLEKYIFALVSNSFAVPVNWLSFATLKSSH